SNIGLRDLKERLSPSSPLICISPVTVAVIAPGRTSYAGRRKVLTCFRIKNASLAAAGVAYGENRSHACPQFTFLPDDAVRSGSSGSHDCLELHHPDARAAQSSGNSTSQLDLCFHLGALVNDGPGA